MYGGGKVVTALEVENFNAPWGFSRCNRLCQSTSASPSAIVWHVASTVSQFEHIFYGCVPAKMMSVSHCYMRNYVDPHERGNGPVCFHDSMG
jgi:hypothetical protein